MNIKQRHSQSGGLMQAWGNPDRTYRRLFQKLDLNCEPDRYPGIVIIANPTHKLAFATETLNLRKVLPQLLKRIKNDDETVVYWGLEKSVISRKEILSNLTSHPIFHG